MLSKGILKLSVLTLCLISTTDSWAIGDLLRKLKNINKSPTEIECKDMETKDLALLCAQEACGDPKDYTAVVNAQTADRYLNDDSKKQIAAIDERMRKAVEEAKAHAKAGNEQLKKLKEIKELSNEESLKYLQTLFIMSEPQNLFREKKGHEIKNLRVAKKINPLSRHYKIHNDFLSKLDLSKNMTEAMEVLSLSAETMLEITKNKLEQFKKELAQSGHSPAEFKELLETDLNTFNVWDYVATQNFYNKLVASAQKVNIQLERPICDESCKTQLVSILQNLELPDLEKKAEEELKRFSVEDRIAECKAQVTIASVDSDLAKIEKEWPGIKDRADKLFLSKFSKHSQGLLRDKIEGIKLMTSPLIDAKKKNIDATLTSLPWGDSPQIVLNSIDSRGESDIPRCHFKPRNVPLITDFMAYYPRLDAGEINVSPYSCEHTETGVHILAHELGHAISYFMAGSPGMSASSKEEFVAIRRCSDSSKKTTKIPSLSPIYEKDKFTTEEDVADLVSHLLAPKDNNKLKGCALIAPNEEQFNELGTRRSLLDTHSASLMRLLVELQYKRAGQIPEACQVLMERKGHKLTKKCI